MSTLGRAAALLVLSSLASAARADEPVEYTLEIDREARRWQMQGVFPVASVDEVDLWFPRWTSGAYHLAEFGRWVKTLEARDANGNALTVRRETDCHFVLETGGRSPVSVQWTADSMSPNGFEMKVLDVESNRITDDYAYVNPPSLFPFVPALIDRPVRLGVSVPEGWKTATVLEQAPDGAYEAASYWRLEDSPLFFSADHRTLLFEAHGKPHAVTVYGRDEGQSQRIQEGCEKMVNAAQEVMRRVPYERYHFIIGFVPEGQGSGLEHENSTLILLTNQLPGGRVGEDMLWGIIGHEYFHLWLAERIKVESLVRPDYTQPVDTSTIWVNEGMNEYFTQHILLRAGLKDRKGFFQFFSNTAATLPGLERALRQKSWTELSKGMSTWTTDMSQIQLFILRCYQVGPLVILGLDLEMRRVSGGERGVADLLLRLDERYVQKGLGFPEGKMIDVINEVAGGDLRPYYDKYIAGSEIPDFADLLEVLGYRMRGGLRIMMPVDEPSEAQLAALADFFDLPEGAAQEGSR